MAESVDALVSNTSGFTSIPVRPRVWVLEGESFQDFLLFLYSLFLLTKVYKLPSQASKLFKYLNINRYR